MKRVKYGVIGLGWFGQKHCEALAALPNVKLHSLCTRNPTRLAELATSFEVQNTYTDYQQMLADPELEAVSIVTMWDKHLQPTVAALEAGKHVLVEKPLASTVEDCQQIVDAAAAADGYFMTGHICRFNPRYVAAWEAIREGRIGKIISMYARRNIPAAVTEGILDKIGPIIGDGVHDTDLMLWYSQARNTRTSAGPCTALPAAPQGFWKTSGACPIRPLSRSTNGWRSSAPKARSISTKHIPTFPSATRMAGTRPIPLTGPRCMASGPVHCVMSCPTLSPQFSAASHPR
jgi:predicted dehydrogenase